MLTKWIRRFWSEKRCDSPAHQRALLADTLLESLDDEASRKIESASIEEAESRLAAYERGELSALDGPAALRELRGRFAK